MKIAEVIKQATASQMKKHRNLAFLWNIPVGQKVRIKEEDLKAAKAAGLVKGPGGPKSSAVGG